MQKTTWTIGSILKWTGQYFSDKGVDNPRLDAEVLLSHILRKDRLYLYVNFDQPLAPQELAAFRTMVKQRAGRLPVAYIIGNKEFMGLDFSVSPAVLIPRPDTEILVEAVLARLTALPAPEILDIGTGSGAIIVSLLVKLETARGEAVDISEQALAVARKNAGKHGVGERLCLQQGDLYASLAAERVYDAIVSNPPYIPEADIAGLEAEVQQEPRLALAGGADGLEFYRRLVEKGASHLKPGGFMALEVGVHQAQAVAGLAVPACGLRVEAVEKDYGGIERVVILVKH